MISIAPFIVKWSLVQGRTPSLLPCPLQRTFLRALWARYPHQRGNKEKRKMSYFIRKWWLLTALWFPWSHLDIHWRWNFVYALFFSKVCDSTWFLLSYHGKRKLKDSIFERRSLWDQCGEVLQAWKVNCTSTYCRDDISNLAVRLLFSVELPALKTSSPCFQVTGAFFLVQLVIVHAALRSATPTKHLNISSPMPVIY